MVILPLSIFVGVNKMSQEYKFKNYATEYRYKELTLNVQPDYGYKTNYVEYCFHQGDHKDWNTVGLDFIEGKDWREVKNMLNKCIEYAKEGKIYNEIICIEKVWQYEDGDGWAANAILFHLSDFNEWEGVVFG